MMPDCPPSFDRSSLHAAYAAGLDPGRVVAAVHERIAAAEDPGIFITLCEDAARAAIERLGPFDPAAKPLWGLPFAIKDNIDLAGVPTTAACPDYAYRPAASATAVARLLAAGAIPVGKTNLDQFATGLVGVRTPYPVPRNAFDPAIVPGGSSSGSAVAVARGLVTFALGTDTAGSGRIPAGLNNLVGLKPSVGAVPIRGVVPACRTLDCVSVFALTVADAWAAFAAMAGPDADDPFSRSVPLGQPGICPSGLRFGLPDRASRRFFGDAVGEAAFDAALERAGSLGVELVEVDFAPFFAVAALLYEGAWVAERYAAVQSFLEGGIGRLHPTTQAIIGAARSLTAADAFRGFYRLADLRSAVAPVLSALDGLIVPTVPRPVTLADIAADPIGPNSRLGTYTNFVNLLDLCALAVPGPFRRDGFPAGVTLIGPRGQDAELASLGAALQVAAAVPLGATGQPQPATAPQAPLRSAERIALVVVGAHLSGLPLSGELTRLGGRLSRRVSTRPDYKLFALPGGPPYRPGLVRVPPGSGHAIAAEVWTLPVEGFGRFVASVPAPLAIGTVLLADGTSCKGFLCEGAATAGAEDISSFGGWRAYIASRQAST